MGPAVGSAAAPFGDGSTRAFGNGKSAFVAGRFDDGVILGGEEGVIEDEDGLFGGRKNDELIGVNLRVHGGENFTKPGSAW